MNWKEYQDIIGEMYATAEGGGLVRKNITLPDKTTGQPRQIDAWWKIKSKGHTFHVLIDAKFRKSKVDVKDVEEVLSLAEAVGAHHSVLVATNGWTGPAEAKSKASRIDLRIVTIEEAVEIVSPDVWKACPFCQQDCIIMDQDGMAIIEGLVLWWLAGQCRQCKSGRVWCQDCGEKVFIRFNETYICSCNHEWHASKNGIKIKFKGSRKQTKKQARNEAETQHDLFTDKSPSAL